MVPSDPDTYIEGLWFIGNGKMDVLAYLTRNKKKHWQFDYRFRYYKSDQAFFSDDVKKHYTLSCPLEELPIIKAKLRPVIKMIAKGMGGKTQVDYVILQCQANDPKILAKLKKFEWCHFQELEQNQ